MSKDEYIIRPYNKEDEASLLALWNQVMPFDPISPMVFRTKVLMDLNFNPQGLLVTQVGDEANGPLVGFVLSLLRQTPQFLDGLEEDRGWITAFGVHAEHRRRGVGRRLFKAAGDYLRAHGRRRVLISPYTPNYFTPGVDVNAYPEAMAFLKREGWRVQSQPISMQADLNGFIIPEKVRSLEHSLAQQGVVIRPVEAADLVELFPFIQRHFGWDWVRFAQDYLLELFGRGADDIVFLVAVLDGEVVGYCQQRRERFGPFGVAPEMRNHGLGRILLFKCLAEMASRAFHCAWFLWTDEDAARLYSLAGFRKARQFAILERLL